MERADTPSKLLVTTPRRRALPDEDCPEKAIVEACQRGEEWAMEALYHRYKRRVYAMVTRIAGANDADEVAQEVFVRIYRGITKFRGDSQLSTWVYRLTVNASLSHVSRRPKPMDGPEALERVAAPEVMRRDSGLSRRLEQALAELPAGYRAVLVLHDIQGLNHEECAKIMGCRVGTSKSQLHKARARMREILGPDFAKGGSW